MVTSLKVSWRRISGAQYECHKNWGRKHAASEEQIHPCTLSVSQHPPDRSLVLYVDDTP